LCRKKKKKRHGWEETVGLRTRERQKSRVRKKKGEAQKTTRRGDSWRKGGTAYTWGKRKRGNFPRGSLPVKRKNKPFLGKGDRNPFRKGKRAFSKPT